jgi:hypothetical protein
MERAIMMVLPFLLAYLSLINAHLSLYCRTLVVKQQDSLAERVLLF